MYKCLTGCVYVYHMHTWCTQRPEAGVQSSDWQQIDRDSCELSCGARNQTHDLHKGSKSSVDSSLQILFYSFRLCVWVCVCARVCAYMYSSFRVQDRRHCGVRVQEAVNQTEWVLGTRLRPCALLTAEPSLQPPTHIYSKSAPGHT